MATLIAALLASAAAVLISSAKTTHSVFGEEERIERARFQAEALAADAEVELDTGTARFTFDGSPAALAHASAPGVVRLQDAVGLVDLNAAQPPQLATLFVAVGVQPDRAAVLADRVADWRDPSGLRRPLGAQAAEYAAAGAPPPANRPFEIETEIEKVLGVSPALARCVEPLVTVYSGASVVDPASAPPLVRQAVHAVGGASISIGAPIGHVLILTADAPISKAAAFRLTQWVRLTGDAARPIMIHRAASELVPIADGGPAPACVLPPEPKEGA
jgi:general secretion pathway protein K